MDINHGLNSAIDYFGSTRSIYLFKNPLWVAIIITFIILIVVVSVYEENKLIKTGIYIFLSSLCIIFIHNKLLLKEYENNLITDDQYNIVGGIDDMRSSNVSGGVDNLLDTHTGASDLEYFI